MLDRILMAIERRGFTGRGSRKTLAETLGYSAGSVTDIMQGKANPGDRFIRIFCEKLVISEKWLRTGEGEWETCGPALAQGFKNINAVINNFFEGERDTNRPGSEACGIVDIYNMVEAGTGTEPEWHEPVDRRAIPTGFLKPNVRPVLVRGRSMEPTFKNGAIIGVDQSDKQVIEGEAYAIVLPYSGAAVKRLYPLPDGVLIRSDNKEFPEVTLKKEDVPDFFILGRVCWVVQEV